MSEHLGVCGGEAVLVPCVVELIERPADVLFILGERFILFSQLGSKGRQILIDQIAIEIVPDGLLADPSAGGNA